jgi:methylmalonyl-CoA mutase cobalamin-binding subunit
MRFRDRLRQPRAGLSELDALTAASLVDDLAAAQALCHGLRARGLGWDEVLRDLVEPAARMLHERWLQDECDFVQVTVACDLLKRLVLSLADAPQPGPPRFESAPRVLLLPVPGSQHTLGLTIVAKAFIGARWEVSVMPHLTMGELPALAGTRRLDIVGFSIGAETQEALLARAIALWRSSCVTPNGRVMVGGPALRADPGLADRVGADASAVDAEQAVCVAGDLLREISVEAA